MNMPGPARPFVAVKAFSCANQRFRKGDVVDHPIVLASVRDLGDEFVTAAPAPKSTTNKES